MKTTRILSMILALCMVISVISIGAVSASAAEVEDEYAAVAAKLDDLTEKISTLEDAPTGVISETGDNEPSGDVTDVTEAPTETATTAETQAETIAPADIARTDDNSNAGTARWRTSLGYVCSINDFKIISPVTQDLLHNDDFDFFPSHVIATLDISGGTCYAFLCSFCESSKKIERDSAGMSEDEKTAYKTEHTLYGDWWEVLTVFVDSENNSKLIGREKIEITDIKTLEKSPDRAWNITVKGARQLLVDYDQKALDNYTDLKLDAIAQLGIQDRPGDLIRLLCYGTKDSKTDLYVVDIQDNDGVQEVKTVSVFDLDAYTTTPEEVSEQTSGANASPKSPNTGHTDAATLMMILFVMAAFGAGVSVYNLKRKED